MKEFNLDDIVDELHKELGFTSSKVALRRILRQNLNYILKVMATKRDRIIMRENDIHTIYTNPDIMELQGKVADVDETKVMGFENGFAIKDKKFRDPYKAQKRASRIAQARVNDLPKLNA